jgi:hypothetical protein
VSLTRVGAGTAGLGLWVATFALAGAAPLGAQGVRGHLTTTVRYIEMRPVQQETVSFDEVTRRPDGFYEYEGRRVHCVEDVYCSFYVALPVQHAVPFTQDATATAWGLGVQGLSATVSLRARSELGGEFTWPRSDDAFDARLVYAELNRGSYRIRLGRLRTVGGLAFSGYDGASVWVRPTRWLRGEVYGGRSLARALYEPRFEALQAIEDFVIDKSAVLIGGYAEIEAAPGSVFSLRYQREIWSDRSGLVSERAALDFRTQALRHVTVSGSADYDVAFNVLGKANLTLQVPLRSAGLVFEAAARRYRPYFELWTVWGYFDPVAYNEIDGRVAWTPGGDLGLWASAGYRKYEDTHTEPYLAPLEDETLRGATGLSWTPGSWRLEGTYRLEHGGGSTLSAFDARARWSAGDRITVGLHGTAFQQIEEFRIGEVKGLGGGLMFDARLTGRLSLDGGASLYRNLLEKREGIPDWDQVRGWTALRIDLGTEPRAQGPRLRR